MVLLAMPQELVFGSYVAAAPSPRGPLILQNESTTPASPYGPLHPGKDRLTAFIIPKQVHAEYNARRTLCAITNMKNNLVLLMDHGLWLRCALYRLR
jgi:hypothetical protein